MKPTSDALIIETRVAHAGFEEHTFCGRRVFGELAGRSTMAGTVLLGLSGRVASAVDCALIDDLVACVTMADPRIWPLKVSRVVGAYGNFLPAFAAGYLSTDHAAAGPASIAPAMEHLRELVRLTDGNVNDVQAVREAWQALRARHRQLAGFGVPFRERDERVEALRQFVRARDRDKRPHWSLLETLREVLRSGASKLELNAALAIAAIALDIGFEPELGPLLGAALLTPCFLANAREAALSPADSLRELPEARVEYVGRARRRSPLSERAR